LLLDKIWQNMRKLAVAAVAVTTLGCASIAGAEAIQIGDDGADVVEIQETLASMGYAVQADGQYGPSTAEAVKAFQKSQGMESDGIIGRSTYVALLGKDMPEISRGSSNVGRRIVSSAMQYLGAPYVWGATGPYGFDCSGFTYAIFAGAGIALPRMADEQFEVGRPVPRDALRPGDLVFFTTYEPGASHVGIYIGNGNFVHASSVSDVTITPLSKSYYAERYLGARRMF